MTDIQKIIRELPNFKNFLTNPQNSLVPKHWKNIEHFVKSTNEARSQLNSVQKTGNIEGLGKSKVLEQLRAFKDLIEHNKTSLEQLNNLAEKAGDIQGTIKNLIDKIPGLSQDNKSTVKNLCGETIISAISDIPNLNKLVKNELHKNKSSYDSISTAIKGISEFKKLIGKNVNLSEEILNNITSTAVNTISESSLGKYAQNEFNKSEYLMKATSNVLSGVLKFKKSLDKINPKLSEQVSNKVALTTISMIAQFAPISLGPAGIVVRACAVHAVSNLLKTKNLEKNLEHVKKNLGKHTLNALEKKGQEPRRER